jgi:septal ring factor EnvC (AmiA/AmiB activator)
MQADLILLENRLKELDRKIAEINKRLPAHSVKPPIMTELFELEDERDAVAKQLDALKQSGDRFLIKGEQ